MSRPLVVVASVVVSLRGLGGCKDRPASPPVAGDAPRAPTTVPRDGGGAARAPTDGGPARAPDAGASARRAPLPAPATVDAALATWLAAQNEGDFDAYAALYDAAFTGVRRSGKQTVRLDRAGWLADRKKMFRRAMEVAASDVVIVRGPGRATATFVQTWASGTYRDVGPKVIEWVADGDALRIAREEMLRSQIVRPPRAGAGPGASGLPPVLPVLGDAIVLAGRLEPGWAFGAPTLEDGGEPPTRDPSCDDDPPDYETDNSRYFECLASDPGQGYDQFAASAPADVSTLPATLTAWLGAKVRLGGVGPGCTATVARLEAYAEREATYAAVGADTGDDDAVAAAVMAGAPALVAIVSGGCEATWAQLEARPAAVTWTAAPAPDALARAVRARLRADGRDDGVDDVPVQLLSSPGGRTFALAAVLATDCDPWAGFHVMYLVERGAPRGDAVLDERDPGEIVAVVDGDGDGWPEVVFDDGVAVRAPDLEQYVRDRMVRFPDEIADCGD